MSDDVKRHTVRRAITEATVVAFGVALLLFSTLPINVLTVNPSHDFVRRWDGCCTGWTRQLALFHMVPELVTWWAYINISFVIARLHPVLKSVPSSRYSLPMTVAFFPLCGGTHLLNAYAFLNPVYRPIGWFLWLTSVVSLAGSVLIAFSLVAAFSVVAANRKRAAEIERKLAKLEGR